MKCKRAIPYSIPINVTNPTKCRGEQPDKLVEDPIALQFQQNGHILRKYNAWKCQNDIS